MFLNFILLILAFLIARIIIITICIIYNNYRINSKFKELYDNAKDDRMRKDLLIDYNKMDKTTPINIITLVFAITKNIDCDELLSEEARYFLYEF